MIDPVYCLVQYCMKRAVDNNMYVVTHIHLDDGLDRGTWRNSIIFNPQQKYNGWSFWDAIGAPTAKAIRDANYKKRDVYYAMQVCTISFIIDPALLSGRPAWHSKCHAGLNATLHLSGQGTGDAAWDNKQPLYPLEVLVMTLAVSCSHQETPLSVLLVAAWGCSQAEMGATLFYYPVQWRNVMGQIKNAISAKGTPKSKVKVGVNINWEKICGCPSELIFSSNYYNVRLTRMVAIVAKGQAGCLEHEQLCIISISVCAICQQCTATCTLCQWC
jgi:hypothetical protein